MSKLLDQAISKIRELPEERQDELAADILLELSEEPQSYRHRLTEAQLAEVRLALKEMDEGKFASQEELAAFWRRAGVSN